MHVSEKSPNSLQAKLSNFCQVPGFMSNLFVVFGWIMRFALGCVEYHGERMLPFAVHLPLEQDESLPSTLQPRIGLEIL